MGMAILSAYIQTKQRVLAGFFCHMAEEPADPVGRAQKLITMSVYHYILWLSSDFMFNSQDVVLLYLSGYWEYKGLPDAAPAFAKDGVKVYTDTMYTKTAKLTFYIPQAASLKDKRQVCRSLLDKVRKRFNVSAAETGAQDSHHTLVLGVAVVSGDAAHAADSMDAVIRFMEQNADAELVEVVRSDDRID